MTTEPQPPCFATFLGRNGYELGLQQALKVLEVGKQYRVTGGSQGQSHTSLTLEGVDGSFNSVMFEYDEATAPIEPMLKSCINMPEFTKKLP
jgi:hypothetical protein